MKAHLNLSPSGCMWLELQAEGVAEHQMLNHWAYRCQVHGVHAAGNPVQVDGGLQLVLRDGLLWPAKPADVPKDPPVHEAAPQVERRYVPPSRDGVGSYSVTPQEVTATLRPGPDGVPLKVEPETVIPGQPIRPGVIGADPAARYVPPQRAGVGEVEVTLQGIQPVAPEPACERELVATREAVRRLWCHVQAVNPAGLDRQSAGIHSELRREIEALACVAEVK